MNLDNSGKDKWKYEKIYNQTGRLHKKGENFEFEGTIQDFKKNNILNKWIKYGHSFEGRKHINKILSLRPKSIIDIGCGGNEFCNHLKKRKRYFFNQKKFVGVDIACPSADIIAPAHNISTVKDKEFDLCTSFDCIEHIPEEEIEASFKEFTRISNRVFLQICLELSPTTIDGKDLHVCIKPEEWWVDLAKKYFYNLEYYINGESTYDPNLNRVVYKNGSGVRELIIFGQCKTFKKK